MPQVLVRKLTKDAVDKLVAESKMPLTVENHVSGKEQLLLVKSSAEVKDLPLGPGMAAAIQKIADADAEITNRERKEREDQEKAAALAATAAAASG